MAYLRTRGRLSRHASLNDVIRRILASANGLARYDGKRPDGITLVPWQNGKCLVWDATCVDTLAASHIKSSCVKAGAAAATAEAKKRRKYAIIEDNYIFMPFVVETRGPWGPSPLKLFRELSKRLFEVSGDQRADAYLGQRISIAIQRVNATCHILVIWVMFFIFVVAAFDTVSRLIINRADKSDLDLRLVKLPPGHDGSRDLIDGSENEYEPYDNRDITSPIDPVTATFSLLRSMFGVGVLAMPLAISQAGMVLGCLLTLSIIAIIYHTHIMLLKCLHDMSKMLKIPYIPYRYGFKLALMHGPYVFRAFGEFGMEIIVTFMFLNQFGLCCVSIVFTADSVRDLFDLENVQLALYFLYFPIIILVFVMEPITRALDITKAGNILMIIGIVLTMIEFFNGEPYNDYIYVTENPALIMIAVGIILFNHSAISQVLQIEKSLESPKTLVRPFTGILFIGIFTPGLFGMVFGVVGYWKFGVMDENVLRALQINEPITQCIFTCYGLAIILAFPFLCYPAIKMLENAYLTFFHEKYEPSTEYAILHSFKIMYVTLAFVTIHTFPFQGPFVAFVGSECTSLLGIVFPAIMQLGLMYPGKYGRFNIYLIKNILLIIIGLTIFICGGILCAYILYMRAEAAHARG